MIYPSLLVFSKFLVKHFMSRLSDFLPCSSARRNVVTPIVCPDDESSMPEIDGVDPQIGTITDYSSDEPLRNTVHPRTADLRTSAPPQLAVRPRTAGHTGTNNNPQTVHHLKSCNQASVYSQTTLLSESTVSCQSDMPTQGDLTSALSFDALRQDLKVVLGVTVSSTDKILSEITVLQNNFAVYDRRLENIESRVSLIEEGSLTSVERSLSGTKELHDPQVSVSRTDDRMLYEVRR